MLKSKVVDGNRIIKARLADEVSTVDVTATGWSQRLVNAICAQRRWALFSAAVPQAVLRGLTFEQIEQMEGEIRREVQLTLPPGSIPVSWKLPGYESVDSGTDVLRMLRGGFGLKDAPRFWQKTLRSVLERIGVVSLIADPKLYVHRQGNDIRLICHLTSMT